MRLRKNKCKTYRPPGDTSISSSSDSDDKGTCKKKKRKTRCEKKSDKKPDCPFYKRWIPCLSIPHRMRSGWDNMACGCGLSPLNTRCFIAYAVILSAILLYLFGGQLWGLTKTLLYSTLFKSTSTIVDEALAKYNADKLGLADYALESAGGSILCSSNTYYSRNGALYSIFGVPLWYHYSSPREVIQPDVQPGKCWAMDGDKGYVVVQLSMPVVVSAVSLEHIPAQVAPSGRLDSAPKDFSIVGKESNMDSPEIHLGTFLYKADLGNPIQTFHLKDPYCLRQTINFFECGPNKQVFRIIELRILSNHGNRDYTCIYRLRVHGKPLVHSNDKSTAP